MTSKEYFISGIDTDCGKTYITGLLAFHLKKTGKNFITTKLVQTGCKGISEDILTHRKMSETDILPEDRSGETCPFVYTFPASPHLASQIDKKTIDLKLIRQTTDSLLQQYDICLTEGAGGLMVPITDSYFTIDYIREHKLPLILVTSSKLGSINHTLLSLELCKQHNVNLHALIYNEFPNSDPFIAKDSFKYFKKYLEGNFPETVLIHSKELDRKEEFEIVL